MRSPFDYGEKNQPMMKSKKAQKEAAKAQMAAIICLLIFTLKTQANVFINEVFLNPLADQDNYREYIELLGTPGRKLDGYAIAALNGTQEKLYPLGSIPPLPPDAINQEIDEFFSLDGLTLGRNGILVLGAYTGSTFWYPALLPDSNFSKWTTLWNGGLDVPGVISNEGSTTFILVRNRPGQTEADPCDPAGLRWGKQIHHDAQLITPVWDSKDECLKDQWGDGNLDLGEPNGLGGCTLDLTGATTGGDIMDDLEVMDEVSFEDQRGWEYDVDGRHVDLGSTIVGLPHRHVHALDDPIGFNPDALSRVDYRTKGLGWAPAEGGIGETPTGNNWQDTATEQWIRGESTTGNVPGEDNRFGFFYENSSNPDANALQPYITNVPLWLDDGNVPDYNFGSITTYEISAGRINHLAVPFIPGDCDRDGLCDINDILNIKAVFGANDWVFSNGFPGALEGDSGDPAVQIRPWDVDATGDNGIEASDLQWTLNFQGDTTGQIVGIQYDSPTPAADGVHLNSNAGVECTVTASVNIPSGRSLDTLLVGDIVEITVRGQVTTGPNTTTGQENGIMQYIHDIVMSTAGIVKVTSIEPLDSFDVTRMSLQELQGTNGDLGVELINGYTTSFTKGLTGPDDLYRITLEAIGEGGADVYILPALESKFADSTPHGLKIGHTDYNGNPNSSDYPAPVAITVTAQIADIDGDDDVDFKDFAILADQWNQAPGSPSADVAPPNGGDGMVNTLDLSVLAGGWLAGTGV